MQISKNNLNFNYCVTTATPTTFDDILHYSGILTMYKTIMLATDTNTFIMVNGISSVPTVNKTLYNMINRAHPDDQVIWVRTYFEEGNSFPIVRLGWKTGDYYRYRKIYYDENDNGWKADQIEAVHVDEDTEFNSHTWICGAYYNSGATEEARVYMNCYILLNEYYYLKIAAYTNTNANDYYYVNVETHYSSTSIRTDSLPSITTTSTSNVLAQLISNSGGNAGSSINKLQSDVEGLSEHLDEVESTAEHAEETANSIASKTSSIFVSR